MTAFVARRLLAMVPTLWVIGTVTFFLVHAAPGDPFASEREIPEAAREALAAKYGLDRPLLAQYVTFLGNAVRLDFGPSLNNPNQDVREILLEAFPVSLELGAWALLLALAIGIPAGMWAAARQNRAADHVSMSLALLGVSIPNFVLGPLLVLLFALSLYLFPAALWFGPESRVLPVVTLAAIYVAYIARLTRGGMLETLRQDYIRTARAKGLPEHVVVGRHALRLGILPVVSYLGPAAAGILTGSFVVETMFAVPGMGQWFVKGAVNRDYSLVLGTALVYAVLVATLNLASDLLTAWLDPRVRDER